MSSVESVQFERRTYLGGLVTVTSETQSSRDANVAAAVDEHDRAGKMWKSLGDEQDQLRDLLKSRELHLGSIKPLVKEVKFLGKSIPWLKRAFPEESQEIIDLRNQVWGTFVTRHKLEFLNLACNNQTEAENLLEEAENLLADSRSESTDQKERELVLMA